MMDSLECQDLFVAGTGGYHTYRIPALAVTTSGTLLAFCEGRRHGRSDAGEIDMLLRRSLDGGATWRATQVVVVEDGMTCGNPAPVIDRNTGTIWLPFCKNLAEGNQNLICAGKAPRTVWLTHSIDDGATWTEPVEITAAVKDPSWTWYATGPGHGVQLESGRLVVACDHQVGVDFTRQDPGHSHIIYSDDHGTTWQLGGIVPEDGTNESAIVDLGGDAIYLNCRDQQKRGQRAGAWSADGGLSFSETCWHDDLVEPPCQGSLVRVPNPDPATLSGHPLVIFANPASRERTTLTVRLSEDGCRTWSRGRVLEVGPSAYSDLAAGPMVADGTSGEGAGISTPVILCLYERGDETPYDRITLARFTLSWLER